VEAVILDYVLNFLGIVWEALPFIILGALIAGILEEMLPQQALANLLPKNAFLAILVGGVLGLIFPMCECGIVVVMRRLLRKGLPLSCCVAYMLAGPIVNLIVLGSTFVAFKDHTTLDGTPLGWPMVALRAGLGFLVAVSSALVVHVLTTRAKTNELLTAKATGDTQQPNAKPTLSLNVVETTVAPEPKKPWKQRLDNITNTALKDFIDITVFLILGSALAALVRADPALVQNLETLSQSNPILAIPLMMLMALLLCLCSEADAFLAASFKGMSISAKLAFLVFGPMLDLKLLLMYTRVFKLKLILTIVASVTVFTLIACTLVHFVYNPPVMGQATTVVVGK
jgi:uncharacterized protein